MTEVQSVSPAATEEIEHAPIGADAAIERPVADTAEEVPGPRPIRPGAVLRVEELQVRFAGADTPPAVDRVSFSVERGEVLALVGESGSGKTVTAQAILGLLPPTAETTGRIQLTSDPVGRPAHEQPDLLGRSDREWRDVRGSVAAMVFQEPQTALNPVRTIGWQLTEAVRAHRAVSRRAARDRALELLTLVGLPDPARRLEAYPHQLSGGQKQRVVIALALANDPALLIADEPTTALDVTVQAEILTLLRSVRERLGTAILLITHNMGVVADLADRVLVMRQGRMVERGEVLSLFAGPFTPYTRTLLASVPRPPGALAGHPNDVAPDHPDALSARPSAVGPVPTTALTIHEVTVDYPGRFGRTGFRALEDVTVTLPAGRVLGVVGESGSGKTTLAKVIAGQLPAAAGTVEVAGADLSSLSRAALQQHRRLLGVVHQDPATTLDPLLPIGESIAEPLVVHRAARGPEIGRRVRSLLDDVSLPAGYERRLPHELSGGQRQRVALARALALRPALLIADEPTSALDVTVQASILRLFADLRSAYGFACVFISHDLAVIDTVSDDLLVLRAGRVVEAGPTRATLRSPRSDYTARLLAAVPLPDPVEQRARRDR